MREDRAVPVRVGERGLPRSRAMLEEKVPIGRVLPFATSHLRLVAARIVGGRLRVIFAGVWPCVAREDYLALCEAAWQSTLDEKLSEARVKCVERRPPEVEPPVLRETPAPRSVRPRSKATSKPIHDGHIPDPIGDKLRRGLGRLIARFRRP